VMVTGPVVGTIVWKVPLYWPVYVPALHPEALAAPSGTANIEPDASAIAVCAGESESLTEGAASETSEPPNGAPDDTLLHPAGSTTIPATTRPARRTLAEGNKLTPITDRP
jgi:hypothetical protein